MLNWISFTREFNKDKPGYNEVSVGM